MKPRHNPLHLFSAATALALASSAQAANITWDTPAAIAGDSDVFNVGSLQYGYTESAAGTTVNGVSFAAGNSTTDLGSGNVTMTGFDGGVDTGSYIGSNPLGLSSASQTLVRGGAWSYGGAATVILNNLGTGHVYAMQYWVADYRWYPNDRNLTLTGGANTSGPLKFLDGDSSVSTIHGSYVIGRFTADTTSQAITVTANESAQMNAIQLRDLTGVWKGTTSGNLNNADANFNGGSYSTISTLGTPVTSLHFADTDGFGNAVTANTLTVDAAGFSAGSLNFQNNSVNYTLQNASGTTGITGATAINKSGSGTLTLASANTHSGATSLNGGTLRLENAAALGSGSLNMASGTTLQLRADSNATFSGGDNLGGLGGASITIDVNQLTSGNTDKTLSFATGGFNTYNTTINVTGGNGYTLALGGINEGYNGTLALNSNSGNLTIGNIGSASAVSSLSVGGDANTTITGAISSSGGLSKSGNGTLTLSGSSSYGGGTTVTAGKLIVNGDNSGATGAVTVASGATLGGSGTVGGATTIQSGGHLAVGNSPGTQTFSSNLDLQTGSIFDWDLAGNTNSGRGTNYDGVDVTGTLTIASDAVFRVIQNTGLVFNDTFWDTTRTWSNIFNVTGTLTSNWSNAAVSVYNTDNELQNVASYGSFTINGTTLTWTAVPEPTGALAGFLMGAGFLRRRRRD